MDFGAIPVLIYALITVLMAALGLTVFATLVNMDTGASIARTYAPKIAQFVKSRMQSALDVSQVLVKIVALHDAPVKSPTYVNLLSVN